MAIRKIDEIVKLGKHPLEEHFDIEEGSTELVTTKRRTELSVHELYDEKDIELEEDNQVILDAALDIFDTLKEQIQGNTEAKYLARLAEVSSQMLNVAQGAIKEKARLKETKEKLEIAKNKVVNKTTVNNTQTIVATHTDIIKMMSSGELNDIIGEFEEIDPIKSITDE